jgi:hypothetical protein
MLILPSHLCLGLLSTLSPSGFQPKFCTLLIPPCVLHASSISTSLTWSS